jgi:hypothetical protein
MEHIEEHHPQFGRKIKILVNGKGFQRKTQRLVGGEGGNLLMVSTRCSILQSIANPAVYKPMVLFRLNGIFISVYRVSEKGPNG